MDTVRAGRATRKVNLHAQKPARSVIVETVTSPEELSARLKNQRAASMLKLGTRLIELGLITEEQLDRALRIQRADSSRHLGQVLVDLDFVAEIHLGQIVCEQLGIPLVELGRFPVDRSILALLPERLARDRNMLPLCSIDGQLFVAMSDPLDIEAIEQARFSAQMNVVPVMALHDELQDALRAYYDHAAIPFAQLRTVQSMVAAPSLEDRMLEMPSTLTPPARPARSAPLRAAVIETVSSPEELRERLNRQYAATMLKLGVRLIELKLITREQLEHALRVQRTSSRHLGQVLLDLQLITEPHLRQVVCEQLGIALVALEEFPIDHAVLRLLPAKAAREYTMVPLCCIEAQLVVAMANPLNAEAVEQARFCAQMAVMPVMALRLEIEQAIHHLYDETVLPYQSTMRSREYGTGTAQAHA